MKLCMKLLLGQRGFDAKKQTRQSDDKKRKVLADILLRLDFSRFHVQSPQAIS